MSITLTEDDSCPRAEYPGDLGVPDPGSPSCQKCEHNKSTKSNENRVHDLCPWWTIECTYTRPKLKPGTRIRFLRNLESSADEEGPGNTYAKKGDLGTVELQAGRHEPHGTWEGYWVFWDRWSSASFGCEAKDFEVLQDEPLRVIHLRLDYGWPVCDNKLIAPITRYIDKCTCLKCLNRHPASQFTEHRSHDKIIERIKEITHE